MARLRSNFNSGLITDNPLTNSATTINSAAFANLPEVTAPDILVLVLDPLGEGNGPEIVHVTAHTAAATSVTVLRAAEDATDFPAVQHALSTPWVHGPTVDDWAESAIHNHDADYSDIAHEGGTDVADHPEATTSTRGFMSSGDKTKLDGIEAGAKADMTAAEIRTAGFFDITNDGAGSGLDADKLDGQEGAYYSPGTHDHDADYADIAHEGATGAAHGSASVSVAGFMSSGDKTKLDGVETGATADQSASEILTAIKTVDGAGSGLDADLLDGVQASGYAAIDSSYAEDTDFDLVAEGGGLSYGSGGTAVAYGEKTNGWWDIHFRVKFGSSGFNGGSGDWYLTGLPAPHANYGQDTAVGTVSFMQNGSTDYIGVVAWDDSSSRWKMLAWASTDFVSLSQGPVPWGNNDSLAGSMRFKSA
jgi:hypothetical protein